MTEHSTFTDRLATAIFDPLTFLVEPGRWAQPYRRVFLLTLPVSGPVICALWLGMFLLILVMSGVYLTEQMPRGVFSGRADWFRTMWNGRPGADR